MLKTLEEKAQAAADGLGISFYIRDGKLWQNGPGIEVRPCASARPTPHDIMKPQDAAPGPSVP